jgi:hypothetical protein
MGTMVFEGPNRNDPADRSRRAPKTLGESGRGRHSHSIDPSGAIRQLFSQSERKAYSAMGGNSLMVVLFLLKNDVARQREEALRYLVSADATFSILRLTGLPGIRRHPDYWCPVHDRISDLMSDRRSTSARGCRERHPGVLNRTFVGIAG